MVTIFAKTVCDTISNNMKLMLINAETNAALNLQAETIFYPKIQSMAAMYFKQDDINKIFGCTCY